jgi:hypothetical protein
MHLLLPFVAIARSLVPYSWGANGSASAVRVFSEAFRSVGRAALCAALLVFCAVTYPAQAGDEAVQRPDDLRTVLFGSLDVGRSTFGSLGVKRTLSGALDQSGPVGMASLGYGGTVERADHGPDDTHVIRQAIQASAVLGYQWVRDGLVIAAFAGPEADGEGLSHHLTPRMARPQFGARLHGEVWAHPTANTLLTATVIAGTARTAHLWGRTSAGYALWEGVYVGPEASLYATDTYRELRVGAHVTGLTLGRFNLRLSGGWRTEEDSGQHGAYVGISAHIKM